MAISCCCHLNPKGLSRFYDYIACAEKQGICIFLQDAPERCWTKGDVFDFFNARDNQLICDSGQIWGGGFLVKKTPSTMSLFTQHATIIRNNFNLIDDTPSKSKNFDDFRENRHDQSIFSLLCKQHDFITFPYAEVMSESDAFPIIAKRDIAAGWRGYMPYPLKQIYTKLGSAIKNFLAPQH